MPAHDPARSALPQIPGGPELIAHFGRVPMLHDAERRELLFKADTAQPRVVAFDHSREVDERGSYRTTKRAAVEIRLTGIVSVKTVGEGLGGDRSAAIISEMSFEKVKKGIEVDWDAATGLAGRIVARSAATVLHPPPSAL